MWRWRARCPELYGAGVDFSAGIAAVSIDAMTARDFITFITAADSANVVAEQRRRSPLSH